MEEHAFNDILSAEVQSFFMSQESQSAITTRLGFTIISVLAIMVTAAVLLWQQAADTGDLTPPQVVVTADASDEEVLPELAEELVAEPAEETVEDRLEDTVNEVAPPVESLPTEQPAAPVEEAVEDTAVVSNQPVAASTNPSAVVEPVEEQPEQQETITVDLVVANAGFSEEVNVTSGSTVEQVMNASTLQYGSKNFASLGSYVHTIAGQAEDTSAGQYWILYVNGSKANAGISTITVSNGDSIAWKYEN